MIWILRKLQSLCALQNLNVAFRFPIRPSLKKFWRTSIFWAEVNTIVRRELGAIGFCAEKAVLAGEILTGRMTIHLPVSKDGDVYDTLVDEKSKLQSPAILGCVKRRFRRASFTLPEPVEPPPVPEGRKPPEPPPVPKATLHFDF